MRGGHDDEDNTIQPRLEFPVDLASIYTITGRGGMCCSTPDTWAPLLQPEMVKAGSHKYPNKIASKMTASMRLPPRERLFKEIASATAFKSPGAPSEAFGQLQKPSGTFISLRAPSEAFGHLQKPTGNSWHFSAKEQHSLRTCNLQVCRPDFGLCQGSLSRNSATVQEPLFKAATSRIAFKTA